MQVERLDERTGLWVPSGVARDGGALLERLEEALAELELHLEDKGWIAVSGDADGKEFSSQARQTIQRMALLYWTKNPLIGRAVETRTNYVAETGPVIKAAHPLVQDVVDRFWDDEDNQAAFTGLAAFQAADQELQVMGELFPVLFADPVSGRVKVSTIPAYEITDIITDPDNRHRPLYYRRQWTERQWDWEGKAWRQERRDLFYASLRNPEPEPVNATAPGRVLHVAVNRLLFQQRGQSEIYRAMDWAKAYNQFLSDLASVWRALSRFTHRLDVKGGKGQVDKAREKLASTLGALGGFGGETNPPPAAGSTWIQNQAATLESMKVSGASVPASEGRRLALMVASATGVFEHYLLGDPSTGNLATAKSMELPMLKSFEARQGLWRDVLTRILRFVIDADLQATDGLLPKRRDPETGGWVIDEDKDSEGEPIDRTVTIEFPRILEPNWGELAQVLQVGVLLGIPKARLAQIFLSAWDVEDIESILEEMEQAGANEPDPPSGMTESDRRELREAMVELVQEIRSLRESGHGG